jgi:hypothetical protein
MFTTLAALIAPIRFAAPTHVLQGHDASVVGAEPARSGWFESSWELREGLEVSECEFDPREFQFA